MCGFASTDNRINKKAQRSGDTDFIPVQTKISRGDTVATILSSSKENLSVSQWGFDFDFAKTPIHNAQSEKLTQEGSSWYNPFQNLQLCIMPVNSFFEFNWKDPKGKVKIPYRIGLKDFPIFGLAGIYDNQNGQIVTSTLTMGATNHPIGNIHNGGKNGARAPFIIQEQDWHSWLNTTSVEQALNMINIIDPKLLEFYPISREFNKPSADVFSDKWYIREDYRSDEQGSLF